MKSTKQIYIEDFSLLDCEAVFLKAIKEHDKINLILDRTVFYPQGGGQPYDQGVIKSPSATFMVEEVRLLDDVVQHIGKFQENDFHEMDKVVCHVDSERRLLNSKIHSAGHVIDLAVQALKLGWTPGKGYHFPQGPYVEYRGNLEGFDKEKLKDDIEKLCNKYIQENIITKVNFVDKDKVKLICHFVPDYLPENKPVRLIMFGDFAIPCGGTHVKSLSELRNITIRKIKMEKGNVRVSYDVQR